MDSSQDMLMLYVEPTPYIQGLVDRIRQRHTGNVRVVYFGANRSQNWGLSLSSELDEVLTDDASANRKRISELISNPNLRGIQLAGWGGDSLLLWVIWRAYRNRIPTFVESDTPQPPSQPAHRAIIKKIVYPFLFKFPSMFLPGGSRQAEYLRSFGVPESRISIVQMTVDTLSLSNYVSNRSIKERDETRKHFGISDDEVVALFVGRLEPHKGVIDLIESFSDARSKQPGLRLLIVGDGSMSQKIETAAAKVSGIIVAGRLSGNSVWDAYSISDFLVVPSHFEPWGLVVNEGMAAGLPVIASDCVGSTDDLVIEGVTGTSFPVADRKMLAEAITLLANDKKERLAMSESCQKLIGSWTLEVEADLVIKAWGQVCT